MLRIGIFGPADREEVDRLALRLDERGAEAIVFDTREPAAIRIETDDEFACGKSAKRLNGAYVVDLKLPPMRVKQPDGTEDREANARALRDSQRQSTAWSAFFTRLESHCSLVNAPRTWDLHRLKAFEVAASRALGLRVPSSVATTDPNALVELASQPETRWIRKGIIGGHGYTTQFEPPGSLEAARELTQANAVFAQAFINGVNVRAFVVGGECIGAAEAHASSGAEVDSRRETSRLRRIQLPEAAALDAMRAARRWQLGFTAVDFMRDEHTREYYLLEANSAPFFVEFERQTGIAVSSALADHLTRRARRGARAT